MSTHKSLLVNKPLLISLVRDRPAIWDKTMEIYKCKLAKTEAWSGICVALNKKYNRLEPSQRKIYLTHVIRIWTHIRDNWMKCIKHRINNKKERTKPYKYHKQLLFLKKILDEGQREYLENNSTQQENVENENDVETPGASNFSTEMPVIIIEEDGQINISKKGLTVNRIELINLVRERPAIWDKTADAYKNKHAKSEAWREICLAMNKYYEQMNQTKRNQCLKSLIGIWTQIRDTWMRSLKHRRVYKHHEKLLFLKKIITSADLLENLQKMGENDQEYTHIGDSHTNNNSRSQTEMDDDNQSIRTSCSSRPQEMDEDDQEHTHIGDSHINNIINNSISQTEMDDRNYSFFRSIQPTLALFDDDQILQFQAGTISLLQKIKSRRRCNEFHHSTPRDSRMSEEPNSPLHEDPIKIEPRTYRYNRI